MFKSSLVVLLGSKIKDLVSFIKPDFRSMQKQNKGDMEEDCTNIFILVHPQPSAASSPHPSRWDFHKQNKFTIGQQPLDFKTLSTPH